MSQYMMQPNSVSSSSSVPVQMPVVQNQTPTGLGNTSPSQSSEQKDIPVLVKVDDENKVSNTYAFALQPEHHSKMSAFLRALRTELNLKRKVNLIVKGRMRGQLAVVSGDMGMKALVQQLQEKVSRKSYQQQESGDEYDIYVSMEKDTSEPESVPYPTISNKRKDIAHDPDKQQERVNSMTKRLRGFCSENTFVVESDTLVHCKICDRKIKEAPNKICNFRRHYSKHFAKIPDPSQPLMGGGPVIIPQPPDHHPEPTIYRRPGRPRKDDS